MEISPTGLIRFEKAESKIRISKLKDISLEIIQPKEQKSIIKINRTSAICGAILSIPAYV